VCLHDDAWFLWHCLCWFFVVSVGVCGSYICNNISCLVGFFFCASHILAISVSLYLIKCRTPEEENEAHTNKPMLLPPSPSRSEQVEEKKTSLYFLSHLMLAFIPPSSLWWRPQQPTKKKIKGFTSINKRGWPPTYLGSNVFIYLPPPCFFFLRISGRDSV
jgi:hypothetical protein